MTNPDHQNIFPQSCTSEVVNPGDARATRSCLKSASPAASHIPANDTGDHDSATIGIAGGAHAARAPITHFSDQLIAGLCATTIDREVPQPGRVSLQTATFSIPTEDEREFCELPESVREEVRRMLRYSRHIHVAKKKSQAVRWIASQHAGQRGYSVQSIWRKYYALVNSGDWRAIIDRAKSQSSVVSGQLPVAFLEFWRRLCENNQRVCSQAYRELIAIWRTGFDSAKNRYTSIPGYAEWPNAAVETGVPPGWGERNLYRHRPSDFHLSLSRQGRAAASGHRLKMYRTRKGLRIGEFIQFDDHEYNVKVNFPGQFKAMRPRGFTAMDVLSSFPVAKSFKPTLWDLEEEKKCALTEKDFAWFVIHVLCEVGYRADDAGTALCVEWGTAAIRSQLEQRISDATGGRVRVERGGKFGTEGKGRLHVNGQFQGQPKGNFRFKGLIESFWNIIDNYLAGIPGQVGKDRDHSPEQLYGAERYNDKLLKLESVVSGQLSVGFKKPFYSWEEFLTAALACYQAIEDATDHECEGWEKCGFVAKEWRLSESMPWMGFEKLLALPDAERSIAEALIMRSEALHRVRRFSRREAFEKGRHELAKLPPFHWPALMGIENAVGQGDALRVSQGVIEFQDSNIDSEPLRFIAMDEHGRTLTDKYVGFVNPFNTSVLVACDAKLRVKAICPLAEASCHNDVDGIRHQMGRARSLEAAAIREYEQRHGPEIRANKQMREHNAEIIRQASAPERVAPARIQDSTGDTLERGVRSAETEIQFD